MASVSLRIRCDSARAASPVIHFDSPCTSPILPSAVMAAFIVTCGRCSRTAVKKTRF
jgi:hypothetical protein